MQCHSQQGSGLGPVVVKGAMLGPVSFSVASLRTSPRIACAELRSLLRLRLLAHVLSYIHARLAEVLARCSGSSVQRLRRSRSPRRRRVSGRCAPHRPLASRLDSPPSRRATVALPRGTLAHTFGSTIASRLDFPLDYPSDVMFRLDRLDDVCGQVLAPLWTKGADAA